MHIAMFGGTGYVGSALRAHLASQRIRVSVFSPHSPSPLYPLETHVVADPWSARIEPGVFTHILDFYGVSGDAACARNPQEAAYRNVDSVRALMHAAAGTGIDRFVYVSTASVFDDGVQKTGNEFFENDVPRPATVYGDTKRIAENLLLSQEKVPCTIIRHPTIYGLSPCMRWDTLMQFCVQQAKKEGVVRMFGDGSAFRPLAALSHVVAGYAHVLHSPPPSQSCFHIVSENEPIRNYLERIQQVAKECGQRISVETVEQSYVPSYRVHSSFPYTNRPEYSFELLQAIWKAAVGRNHL